MRGDLSSRARQIEREHGRKRTNKLAWLKHIDVLDMLEQLDVDNITKATSDEVVFSCVFSGHAHGDEKPSCYMNDGSKNPELTTVFKCHGCNRSGNAVSFLAEHMNISRQKAATELREHYAPGFRKPKYGSIQKEFDARRRELEENEEYTFASLDFLLYKQFEVDWQHYGRSRRYGLYDQLQYMLNRGFTCEDLSAWKIGYDRISDRITIPAFDAKGCFVGVKARSIEKERKPKYLILGDRDGRAPRYGFSPYEKSLIVFGLEKWGEQKQYVFVEGELDVISLWKLSIPAICTGGASMSNVQAQLIKDHCDEVVLFLDDDLAGQNAVRGVDKEDGEHKPGIIEILEPFTRVKLVEKHRYDANEYLRKGNEKRIHKLIAEAIPSFKLKPLTGG